MQTPKHLVQSKKIIAVNFNYRLSGHGFLCLGTKNIPGNAGIKDQVALLLWVKKNIAEFGGNPGDVTISGCGSGSSAVDLLMISKMTKGLFNKVIPQSGANVGVWSVQMDPFKIAIDHAKKFNFKEANTHALEMFYLSANFEQLTNIIILNQDNTFGFVPCIERNISGITSFLHDAPVKILESGNYEKVPMLYGFCAKEGKFRRLLDDMDTEFSDLLPADLRFQNIAAKAEVTNRIRKFYFKGNAIHNKIEAELALGKINQCLKEEIKTEAYVDYFGDILFAYPTVRAVKLHMEAAHEKMYLYEYSYGGGYHSAQTKALMDENNENCLPQKYKKVKAKVRKIWLNFITTGAPAPKDSALPEWMRMRSPLLQTRMSFWHDIYKRHYRAPVPPQIL